MSWFQFFSLYADTVPLKIVQNWYFTVQILNITYKPMITQGYLDATKISSYYFFYFYLL